MTWGEIRYGRDIRPILSDKCFFCHGPDPKTREEDLRLDVREEAIEARAIIPGNPEKSRMIKLIYTTKEADRMPPSSSHKVLTDAEKQLLVDWIKEGAVYEPHWAYTKPKREAGQSIDGIVARDLAARQLDFAQPADAVTLLRRMHFDVIGLPPTTAQVAAFEKAYASDARRAVEQVVEALLASPHFGERMAIPWLDVVRYADTAGYHGDNDISASPYRDYVIRSFNGDKPFDQFTIEQLAGDLLPDATMEQKVAASYLRLNQISKEGGIQDAEYIAKYQAERVRTTASAWLGSTLACAECHDHKFDPFTAKDFYSFAAYFSDILEKGAWTGDGRYQEDPEKFKKMGVAFGEFGPMWHFPSESQAAELAALDKEIAGIEEKLKTPGAVDAAISQQLKAKKGEREALMKRMPSVLATISAKPREVRLLNRGDWQDKSGPVVAPAPPAFLANPGGEKIGSSERGTRLDLARWLVAEENPLTARVFVNRVWAQLFGTGLSKDTGDLGMQGEFPTHPELLDWLAVEFRENKWSVKHLMRTILLSRTYQQSSVPTAALAEKDPQNRWLARQSQIRLPAELIRDNALAVSGLLSTGIGGISAKPYQPAKYYRHLNFPPREYQADKGDMLYRRGVYTHWQRTFLHPMLKAFDAPAREECTPERSSSNTPLQALNLLNDPTFVEAARVMAARVMAEPAGENALIETAWMLCLSRKPTPEERQIAADFHQQELLRFEANPADAAKLLAIGAMPAPPEIPATKLAAAASLCRMLLNLHETITRY